MTGSISEVSSASRLRRESRRQRPDHHGQRRQTRGDLLARSSARLPGSGRVTGEGEEDVVERGARGSRTRRPRCARDRRSSSSARACAALPSVGTPSVRPPGSRWTARPPSMASAAWSRRARRPASGPGAGRPTRCLSSAGRALGDDAAAVDDGDAIGQAVGLFEVLGREEDRHAAVDELPRSPPTSPAGCADPGLS